MSNNYNGGGRGAIQGKTEAELKKGVFAHRIKDRYSTLVPLLIILGTLMVTTTRDLITFRSLKRDVIRQNASQQPYLLRSGAEIDLINSLKDDLLKLSYSDPVAARILADYFPGTAPTKVSGPDAAGGGIPTASTGLPATPSAPADPNAAASTLPPPATK